MVATSLQWKFILTIISFFILVLIMALLDDTLFQFSLKAIKVFSKDWKKTPFDAFMRLFTNAGALIVIAIGSIYCLWFGPKIKQIMFLNSILLSQAANAFLKNVYHQYRPCWAELSVPVYGGEKDYGNPSGHSTGCGAIVLSSLLIYLSNNYDFCLTKAEEKAVNKSRSGFLYRPAVKATITLVGIASFLIIIFSRVFLGAHSFNQILYGSLLGFFCPITILIVFRQDLINYYKHIFLEKPINYKKNVILTLALGVLVLLAHVAVYIILKLSGVRLDAKTLAHIKEYHPNFDADVPLNSGFINFGLGEMAIGAHLGMFFNLYFFSINPTAVTFEVPLMKAIARLLIVAGVGAPIPILAAVFLPVSPPLLFIWIKSVIPALLTGFIIFGITDYILKKLKLLPEVVESIPRPKIIEIIPLIEPSHN